MNHTFLFFCLCFSVQKIFKQFAMSNADYRKQFLSQKKLLVFLFKIKKPKE
jgi:hypothetical protein